MTLRSRLKALEQVQHGEGVEVWWMVEDRPGHYTRQKGQGEALAYGELPACPPGRLRILVEYVEGLGVRE